MGIKIKNNPTISFSVDTIRITEIIFEPFIEDIRRKMSYPGQEDVHLFKEAQLRVATTTGSYDNNGNFIEAPNSAKLFTFKDSELQQIFLDVQTEMAAGKLGSRAFKNAVYKAIINISGLSADVEENRVI